FGTWVRKGHAPGARLLIEILDPGAARLFNPLESQRLAVLPPTDPMLTQIMLDGTVRYIRGTESSGAEPLKYEVELFERKKTGSSSPTKPQNSRAYLSLHPGSLPPEARLLALRIARSPADASLGDRVVSLCRSLATNSQSLRPGAPGATRGLAEFIRGEGGGHCEYFATALAVMLRSLRIPCRLVTGYRSDEWDVKSQELIVRRKHAHAWVEVHDPARGWYTVDASPAGPEGSATSSPSWWKLTETVARQWWTKVLGFDGEARARAMAWLGSLPGRSLEFLRQRLGWTLAFAALAALSVWLRILWRRRRVPAAVRSYLDTVKQLRLERGPGETPRELLERSRELSEQQRELLAAATDEHERERYLA
ncbi:MAG: DUF4129 domain-containing transglutaminase family protein, partial [Planctomycetota bacterium]